MKRDLKSKTIKKRIKSKMKEKGINMKNFSLCSVASCSLRISSMKK